MNIQELHDKLYEVLCTVDDICTENKLTYFLCGGTELGAVREKDFIAWDDDMDMKILAEDWPRFYETMKQCLPEHYHIVTPLDFAPAFYDLGIRIYDDRYPLRITTEEDLYYKNLQNFLGIDVFLLFKIPNDPKKAKIIDFRNRMLYGYGICHRYEQKTGDYSLLQKCEVSVLRTMGRRYSAEKLYQKWYRYMTKWQDLSDYLRYPANWPIDDLRILKKEFYETTAYGEIRGRKFPVPGEYDEELTVMYGDWKIPRKDTKENGVAFIHHTEIDS